MEGLAGRDREVAELEARLGGPGPSLLLVRGRRGAGKTSVVRAALTQVDAEAIWFEAAPLPDPDQRALLARRFRTLLEEDAEAGWELEIEPPEPGADWPELFRSLVEHLYASPRRTALVLDGWDRLVDVRTRLPGLLEAFWREVRTRGLPLHLVLISTRGEAADTLRDPEGPFADWLEADLHLGPLPFRVVTGLLPPGRPARDRLLTHAVFGGMPEVVRHLEVGRTLRTAVQRAVLSQDAPLLRWGVEVLERELQAAGRYASLLRALAGGARRWGELLEASPDFGSGGQMAPYIQRLERLELVRVERSLDAGEGSRSRRYRLADPFVAFWFRFVLPNLTELQLGRGDEVWSRRILPGLDRHAALVFPWTCRRYVREYGDEALPGRAREVGGLWGRGYDLDVAGTLRTGAVFYGSAVWGFGAGAVDRARELEGEMGRTRYGFGREGRHRVLFTDAEPDPELARWAGRDPLAHVVGPVGLVGG